jgi:hypothetical protein
MIIIEIINLLNRGESDMSHAERQAKARHTQIANSTIDQNVTGVTAPGTVKRTHGRRG